MPVEEVGVFGALLRAGRYRVGALLALASPRQDAAQPQVHPPDMFNGLSIGNSYLVSIFSRRHSFQAISDPSARKRAQSHRSVDW